jgi:hypothetical protein
MPCDVALLDRIPVPELADAPVVAHGESGERVGARAMMRSAFTPEQWWAVLRVPERVDEWMPASIGIRRVERVSPDTIYQSIASPVLFGAFEFQRQTLVQVEWHRPAGGLASCFHAVDPAPFAATVSAWDTKAPWDTTITGGWNVDPLPDGGSRVSYQVWADAKVVIPGLQAWVMGRTLPTVMEAYEARVGAVAAGPPDQPAKEK